MYSVYMLEFPDEKKYIGMTGRKLWERFSGGYGYKVQPQVWAAIQEVGWENVKHDALCQVETREEAEAKEKEFIALYHSDQPEHGYNIEGGGRKNKIVADSTRKKMHDSTVGENNPFYGKHLTDEHKAKIRKTYKERGYEPVNKRKILCVDTGIIYESTKEATRQTGIHNYAIRRVCYGQRKTAGGYRWQYV